VNRKYWALLALSKSPQKRLSPVQVQKVLFLVGQYFTDAVGSDYYDFKPYNYGPFDATVYRDLDSLRWEGFVVSVPADGGSWSEYEITAAGSAKAAELVKRADSDALGYIKRVASWARQITFSELVRAVYKHFPAYRENSVFQG
jgi:uncharacterized protein YwgA